MKHPLARALHSVGLNATDVAARLGVDPKTVQRWFGGRTPYPRHRTALVALTGWMERDLWPSLAGPLEPQPPHEVRIAYPHRSSVGVDAWRRLFDRAHHDIWVLAYSALFLAEDTTILQTLRDKASAGCRVRIVLGNPEGHEVAHRGGDEGIDAVMAARIRNALILFRPLASVPNVRVRLHDTVLYNSLYLADDELLVNTHVYGCPASHAPLLHIALAETDGMASTYRDSFERVWASARVA